MGVINVTPDSFADGGLRLEFTLNGDPVRVRFAGSSFLLFDRETGKLLR